MSTDAQKRVPPKSAARGAASYRSNFANILSIVLRDANVRASDRIIERTSLRGTLIWRRKAVVPASRKSASVRAPISAGNAVAARTRRF